MGEAPAHRDRGHAVATLRPQQRVAHFGESELRRSRAEIRKSPGLSENRRKLPVESLIADRDPLVEQRMGDAVFRLRRARKYCRQDLVGLARLDYEALTDGRYGRGR
jgi:hypothetical protein